MKSVLVKIDGTPFFIRIYDRTSIEEGEGQMTEQITDVAVCRQEPIVTKISEDYSSFTSIESIRSWPAFMVNH